MITLKLTRGNDPEGIYIRLPSAQEKIKEAVARLDAISEDVATTRILNIASNVRNLGNYIQNADLSQPDGLQKIEALAEKLQTLDMESCLKFEGMLDANMIQGVDDIMKLADCLDEYVLLPEVGTGSALGRYLVNQGVFECPDHIRPYLDYQAIGQEFYSNHGGAFCRGGYAVQKAELPGNFCRRYEEVNGVLSLDLRTGSGHSHTLSLPASTESLQWAKENLGITDFAEAEIVSAHYEFPYLSVMVSSDLITVESANELASCLAKMQQEDNGVEKYLAILEAEQPETFQSALKLALERDDFERVPMNPEAYGMAALRRIGADPAVMNAIDRYMDFEGYHKTLPNAPAFGSAFIFISGSVSPLRNGRIPLWGCRPSLRASPVSLWIMVRSSPPARRIT